jgi:hypothetical protein
MLNGERLLRTMVFKSLDAGVANGYGVEITTQPIEQVATDLLDLDSEVNDLAEEWPDKLRAVMRYVEEWREARRSV